ncbi:MAG: SDR family NAD(P)-dependent oxidoreductase [Spirochaetia bacterium]
MATAFITGATSGIGLAFAKKLAAEGYDLILTGRREEKIRKEAHAIEQASGVKTDIITGDLTDDSVIEEYIRNIRNQQNLDVLINNAGFGVSDYFTDQPGRVWKDMIKVHIEVPVLLMNAAMEVMKKRKIGIIINISSLASFFPLPKSAIYSAAKLFINTLTEAVSLEEQENIIFKAVCPGFTRTDFHRNMSDTEKEIRENPIFKWMQPEDIVRETWKRLHRGKVIIIPGRRYRFLKAAASLVPSFLYRKIMTSKRGRRNER